MKQKMTESEMKSLANVNTNYLMVNYGEMQRTTHEEHKIFFNLFYGALLGMNWHCQELDANDKIQAIINTAEYQFDLFLPDYSGYNNIYNPLKRIWYAWEEKEI